MNRRSFLHSIVYGSSVGILVPRVFGSDLRSGRAIDGLEERVRSLVDWIRRGFVGGKINLLSNLPSGQTHGGTQRDDLKNLYWLQNCNLFGMYALRAHDPELAEAIRVSYEHWYKTIFPDALEKSEHYLAMGQLPEHTPPDGRYFRAVVKRVEFDGFTIGTETYDPKITGKIVDEDPRSLLKFGAMGSFLRGNKGEALKYFGKALALWDGQGFKNTRMGKHGAYYTRHISYALIAERCLKTRIPGEIRIQMERKLWFCQDTDGGIWTNYMPDGSFPHFAKKTNESGPLTLLAYTIVDGL